MFMRIMAEGWGQKSLHSKICRGFYSLRHQIYVLLHGEAPQMRRKILTTCFGVCSDFCSQPSGVAHTITNSIIDDSLFRALFGILTMSSVANNDLINVDTAMQRVVAIK